MIGSGTCAEPSAVPQAPTVLRAPARSFKRAWRRGRARSRKLVEQLFRQLSLGCPSISKAESHRVSLWMQSSEKSTVNDNKKQTIRDVDNDTDEAISASGNLGTRPTNYLMSLASCCYNVHYLSYRPLVSNECSEISVCSPFQHDTSCSRPYYVSDSTVLVKISILGDSETGKTSFMAKYIYPKGESSPEFVETVGVATEEKVVKVKNGTHIAFNIWDLGGHWQCGSMLPLVCRDAAVVLIMFDLTRRSTLNSVMTWFAQARECNKAAMAVLIGTKYDHFVELPYNIQLAVIQQARVHARHMGAPLFFSSVKHNINVHKVFKVIVAKLFDLPCPVPVNLNFGEPLVDY
ncbi:hypothetical protein KP509_22G059700 [Ceratopteris richardii]|uniref:Uncharacterized protein n=1 Tax=Ceratopteris richardii TaxID=49495 RepID=A0A8T2S7J4_CERRI|nr:hypothetical protein KP509_22G059700 [Ceratopteris richardii]